jgi:vacuolar iron transporter family protein
MVEREASRWRENLRDELDSAALYRRLAEVEEDERLAGIYRRLAEVEEAHAGFWAERLREAGEEVPPHRVGWRPRLLGWLAGRVGTGFVLPTSDAMERSDAGSYDRQPEASATALPAEERSHARPLRAISAGGGGGLQGTSVARLEGRHRAASNSLRPRCSAPTTVCSPTSAW